MQIMTVLVSLVAYVGYIGSMFVSKRKNSEPAVVLLITQAVMMAEQLWYVRENFLIANFSTILIEMGLNSIYPHGVSNYYTENIMLLSQVALKKLPVPTVYRERVFLLFMICQFIAFLFFRSGLGAFYVTSKRYRMEPVIFAEGLAVYTSDLFGPAIMIWRWTIGRERIKGRRVTYGMIALSLSYCEFWWAFEFFCIRLICSVINYCWFKGEISAPANALGLNIDMHGVNYPQIGSRPWVSLTEFNRMAEKGVVTIKVEKNDGKMVKGLGMIVKVNDKPRLITARHVVSDSRTVEITTVDDDVVIEYQGLTWRSHNSRNDDPVVSAPVTCKKELPDLDVVSSGELSGIKDSFYLAIDDSDRDNPELMMNSCGKFTFDTGNDRLNCSVDLKHGDSGGPVIGFLIDGTPRFLGVVSKGNTNQLGGNVVALACMNEHADSSSGSSSEEDEPQSSRLTAAYFNATRNSKRVKRDNAVLMKKHCDIAVRMHKEELIDRAFNDMHNTRLDEHGKKVRWSDLDEGRIEEEDWGEWAKDEDYAQGFRSRAKKSANRRKSERKDRATKKRGAVEAACDLCTSLYGSDAACLLETYISEGYDFELKDDQVLGFQYEQFKPISVHSFDMWDD
jgi:hypothetical protein